MTKKLAIILNADGTHYVDNDHDQSLSSMQETVGGYIELVRLDRRILARLEQRYDVKLPAGTHAYANEEGLILNLEYNALASELLERHLVGNVVITHLDD